MEFLGGETGLLCVCVLAVYKVISYNCRPGERVTPQAYPKPFSDTSTLTYGLWSQAHIRKITYSQCKADQRGLLLLRIPGGKGKLM